MDTTIRNLDDVLYRQAKARAALTGRAVGEIVSEALAVFLARPGPGRKNRSLRELNPEPYPEGAEHLSGQVDAIVYGR